MKQRQPLRTYGLMALGAFILAFGLYNIHAQAGITEGGILGTTLLLLHWLKISPSLSEIVLDIFCYALAFKTLGRGFAKNALISTGFYSLFYFLLERFPPLLPDLSEHLLIASLLGGVFVGCGVGLVVMAGGACGGDDALALTISHYTRWPVSRCYLLTDLTVLVFSLSYIPWQKIVFSLITVTVSSNLIGIFEKKRGQTGENAPEEGSNPE